MASETIAERLAAAGLRVNPLVWRWDGPPNNQWLTYDDDGDPIVSVDDEDRDNEDRIHAESVLAMLEPIPSEEQDRE